MVLPLLTKRSGAPIIMVTGSKTNKNDRSVSELYLPDGRANESVKLFLLYIFIIVYIFVAQHSTESLLEERAFGSSRVDKTISLPGRPVLSTTVVINEISSKIYKKYDLIHALYLNICVNYIVPLRLSSRYFVKKVSRYYNINFTQNKFLKY